MVDVLSLNLGLSATQFDSIVAQTETHVPAPRFQSVIYFKQCL